jgi:integrase
MKPSKLTNSDYDNLAELCAKVGPWLSAVFAMMTILCLRLGEILVLRVRQIDLARHELRIGSKSSVRARLIKFAPDSNLAHVLAACCEGKKPEDYVITDSQGRPRKAFGIIAIWNRVRRSAGLAHWQCRTCGTGTDQNGFCPKCKAKRTTRELKTIGLRLHDLRGVNGPVASLKAATPPAVLEVLGRWDNDSANRRYGISHPGHRHDDHNHNGQKNEQNNESGNTKGQE